MVEDSDFKQMLREAQLRVTIPRLAVMRAVGENPHADTDALIKASRQLVPDISHQTVYDALSVLTGAGLIRRFQPSGSLARYESRVADNHHHLVCRSCGVIADIDCAAGEAPCLTPSASPDVLEGFEIDEAEVIYWGLCPTCASTRSSSQP
jgi:Fur family ferric uptake transcriptional regulator